MAFPVFLSTSGMSGYYLYYGTYPELFGLHQEYIQITVLLLAIGSWMFTVGTFLTLPRQVISNFFPKLLMNKKLASRFAKPLLWALLLVTAVSYYGLLELGFVKLVTMHYGADQWNTIDINPWLRASVLGTPLLCAFITLWGILDRPFNNPLLIVICLLSTLPAVVLGGRKDLIFVLISFAFSASIKRGRNSFKPILIALSAILIFNYIQTLSRDADSLDLTDRLSAISSNQKKENELIGQICVALPIAPTVTAAMTVFPQRQEFYWGRSYVETIIGTSFPKIFFGGQLFESPNANFHTLYYPDIDSFSMDYSLAAEGFQNFGLVGVPMAYFFLGCLMGNLHKLARTHSKSLWVLINLVCFIPGMWSLRSDSNTFFKMSFYSSIALLLLYLIARMRSAPSVHQQPHTLLRPIP